MSEHLLFLTGKLAEKQLHRILETMQPDFTYTVHQLGVKVAALMTTDMILRRLKDSFGANRIIIPGRCQGDVDAVAKGLGVSVERGPDELKDLPMYFGKAAHQYDLSHYNIRIFAEIVDAPTRTVAQILERAHYYQKNGADVIDIGCLPNTPFPHLDEAIQALKQEGFIVSVDSLAADDLLRGGKAGADYLLSLHEHTLWVSDEVASIPVLIPEHHEDLASLDRAIAIMQEKGKPFLVDPILDPIHFGFAESLVRYHTVRQQHPDVEIMMGIGNLTELTHADTAGMNALLLGICSELNINHVLTTEVSQHACRAVREADKARRILYAAKEQGSLPKHIDTSLMALHETSPFPYTFEEIQDLASQITDPSFRIQISKDGIHLFNRDGLQSATDPFEFYPKLGVEKDAGHAFYLGVELARAQIGWQLGKRYNQDEALAWGCATGNDQPAYDSHQYKPLGTTFKKK